MNSDKIEIFGARVHNLRNIDLEIPRDQLVVITGLSGSGKSSLAFDTIYAEGQRRYIETFSAYARQFLGNMERPDVDKINGLSPVISIEQKTTSKNPRSTVGTITEIYDFLRLLFARVATAYSYTTGEPMVSYTTEQIIQLILEKFSNQRINILAPLVKARKGHYRELFERLRKQGYSKVRVNGSISDISGGMRLNRYQTHDIELVVDRLKVEGESKRLRESIELALQQGQGVMMVLAADSDKAQYFSKNLMCPSTGISYPQPEPNTFSFNSPKGACSHCNGLGTSQEIDLDKIIPNAKISIEKGGLAPLESKKSTWIFEQISIIGDKYGFSLKTPIQDIPKEGLDIILYGAKETIEVPNKTLGITRKVSLHFEGIVNFIRDQRAESKSKSVRRWADEFMTTTDCPSCHGERLKLESRHFKINQENIAQVAHKSIAELHHWLVSL